MHDARTQFTRRRVMLGGLALGAMGVWAPGVFAQHLADTPPVEEGPFYPYHNLPLNADNDLIAVSDALAPTVGVITHLGGRLVDESGNPVKNASIEIWQCDSHGVYLAQGDTPQRDKNFRGYGRFTTASDGSYRFRTIKPVPYSGRPAPHIHFKIKKAGQELLTTQLFIRGYTDNNRDGVFMGIADPVDRELASTDFQSVAQSKIGEVTAVYEIVLGRTPADPEPDHHG